MAAQNQRPPIKFNGAYFCSYNLLILKLLEMACCLAVVVLALQFEGTTIIAIEIIAALAVASALSWVLLYMMNLNARFPEFFPQLMCAYHAVTFLLMVAATICAATLWPQFKFPDYPNYAVCTILSAIASMLFLVDAVLSLLWWRSAVDEIITCPCSPWKAEISL